MKQLLSMIIMVVASLSPNMATAQDRTYDDAYNIAKKLDKKVMVIFSKKG